MAKHKKSRFRPISDPLGFFVPPTSAVEEAATSLAAALVKDAGVLSVTAVPVEALAMEEDVAGLRSSPDAPVQFSVVHQVEKAWRPSGYASMSGVPIQPTTMAACVSGISGASAPLDWKKAITCNMKNSVGTDRRT